MKRRKKGYSNCPFSVAGSKTNAAVVVKQQRGFEKLQIFIIEIGGPDAYKECRTLAMMLNEAYDIFQEAQQ